jgi:hypothetical protein
MFTHVGTSLDKEQWSYHACKLLPSQAVNGPFLFRFQEQIMARCSKLGKDITYSAETNARNKPATVWHKAA